MLKTKVFPGFIALALVVAGLYYFSSTSRVNDEDDPSNLLVVVTFAPTPRTGKPLQRGSELDDTVTINIGVAGRNIPVGPALVSPWEIFIRAQAGEHVVVRAQQYAGKQITCDIVRMGNSVGVKAPGAGTGATVVNCSYWMVPIP